MNPAWIIVATAHQAQNHFLALVAYIGYLGGLIASGAETIIATLPAPARNLATISPSSWTAPGTWTGAAIGSMATGKDLVFALICAALTGKLPAGARSNAVRHSTNEGPSTVIELATSTITAVRTSVARTTKTARRTITYTVTQETSVVPFTSPRSSELTTVWDALDKFAADLYKRVIGPKSLALLRSPSFNLLVQFLALLFILQLGLKICRTSLRLIRCLLRKTANVVEETEETERENENDNYVSMEEMHLIQEQIKEAVVVRLNQENEEKQQLISELDKRSQDLEFLDKAMGKLVEQKVAVDMKCEETELRLRIAETKIELAEQEIETANKNNEMAQETIEAVEEKLKVTEKKLEVAEYRINAFGDKNMELISTNEELVSVRDQTIEESRLKEDAAKSEINRLSSKLLETEAMLAESVTKVLELQGLNEQGLPTSKTPANVGESQADTPSNASEHLVKDSDGAGSTVDQAAASVTATETQKASKKASIPQKDITDSKTKARDSIDVQNKKSSPSAAQDKKVAARSAVPLQLQTSPRTEPTTPSTSKHSSGSQEPLRTKGSSSTQEATRMVSSAKPAAKKPMKGLRTDNLFEFGKSRTQPVVQPVVRLPDPDVLSQEPAYVDPVAVSELPVPKASEPVSAVSRSPTPDSTTSSAAEDDNVNKNDNTDEKEKERGWTQVKNRKKKAKVKIP